MLYLGRRQVSSRSDMERPAESSGTSPRHTHTTGVSDRFSPVFFLSQQILKTKTKSTDTLATFPWKLSVAPFILTSAQGWWQSPIGEAVKPTQHTVKHIIGNKDEPFDISSWCPTCCRVLCSRGYAFYWVLLLLLLFLTWVTLWGLRLHRGCTVVMENDGNGWGESRGELIEVCPGKAPFLAASPAELSKNQSGAERSRMIVLLSDNNETLILAAYWYGGWQASLSALLRSPLPHAISFFSHKNMQRYLMLSEYVDDVWVFQSYLVSQPGCDTQLWY